ncbi:unnamed protein product [Paramecium pentaurelia]|uniref:UV excision repair protein RAD23 n=1 Tax=Paramecium pentaurelia TaxID=43138 RepID=A0A8S1XB46_9CILI|nr:unnamed protein product [Paramecium pentaurelia]
MKIIIKTLSGQNFPLDVEGTDTISVVKEKIFQVKQFEVGQQKLLRKGTLLDDKTTIAELGIQENEFLVVMVNAKKSAPQQPQPVQQPPVQQPAQQQPAQQPAQQVPPQQQPQPQGAPVVKPAVSGTGLLSGPEYDKAIEELMSMGFQREECVNAMKAAFNNPDRAVEYLLNGIPPGAISNPPAPVVGGQGQPPAAQQPVSQPAQYQQLRQMYQQNPQAVIQLIPQLLQQLQQTNPELHAQVSQNPEMLLQILMGGGGQQGPPPGSIQLSQQEFKDIETIMGLGFTKQDSLEGYLACDKNVEMAINYLFEKQANGDLFTQHVQREQANPPNQQPPGGNDGPMDEEDDDDVYQ